MDLTGTALKAAIEARARVPGLPVLVLSQHVEPLYARELLATGTHGLGYLLKDRVSDLGRFIEAVRTVAGGGAAIDPEVVAQLLNRHARDERLGRLTPRERQVLALMAEGLT
ncbi:MAG TPA: DNA-binding response regulator, partial [Streptosporangiaceae bacterium]|nr:DNA-binding response regulator [Streptosporangiaceae bacterium]